MEFPKTFGTRRSTSGHGSRTVASRVGITDYAQDALGDVVYVDLPEVGAAVTRDQPFGEVESTKSVSDVYSPVAGTVVERNPSSTTAPSS